MSIAETSPLPARAAHAGFSPGTRHFLIRLIFVALIIPLSFEVATVRFTPILIVLIALFPVIIFRYLSGAVAWRLPDLLFFFFIVWQGLTIFINNPERFITFTGQQTLLTLTGYLAGRLMIQTKEDFYVLIRWVALIIVCSIPLAIYESRTDDALLLSLVQDYTPFNTFGHVNYEPRLGFFRAQVFFVHPIHYGLLSALFLVPFFIGLKGHLSHATRLIGTGLIGFACFLSVSSGAVLSVMLQLMVFIWHRASSVFEKPWRAVVISGGLIFLALELITTKSAFVAVSTRLAFNPSTTRYRTLIWEYGSQQVWRTPIFGNGNNYWARPSWMINSSVDNYWLLMAMTHGLPALCFFLGSIFYAFYMVNRVTGPGSDPAVNRLRLAWTLSLVGFCMSASTVAIWGEIQVLFMFLFGAGFWMMNPDKTHTEGASEAPPMRKGQIRYTRFAPSPGPQAPSLETRTAHGDAHNRYNRKLT